MGADDDPVIRRRRAAAGKSRAAWVLAGLFVAAVGAAGVVVLLLLVNGRGAKGLLPDRGNGDPTAEMLAAHPWWKGHATPAKVSAMLDATEAGLSGREPREVTLYFDSRGGFALAPSVVGPFDRKDFFDGVQSWANARTEHKDYIGRLHGPVRRIEVRKYLRQNPPSRGKLASEVESALYHDGPTHLQPE